MVIFFIVLIAICLMLSHFVSKLFLDNPKNIKENKSENRKFFDSWPNIIFVLLLTLVGLYLMYKFQIGNEELREAAYRGAFSGGVIGGSLYVLIGIWDLLKKKIKKNNPKKIKNTASFKPEWINSTNSSSSSPNSAIKIAIIIVSAVLVMFFVYNLFFSPQARCVNGLKKNFPNSEAEIQLLCHSK